MGDNVTLCLHNPPDSSDWNYNLFKIQKFKIGFYTLIRLFGISRASVWAPIVRLQIISALVASFAFPNLGYCVEKEHIGYENLFHLVGVPGLRRDQRVDLIPTTDGLLFKTKKVEYHVPFERTRQIFLFRADRRYEGMTYAAAIVTPFAIGSLLILKKHPVDTVVLDYVNERGGLMGIVIQMERVQGEALKTLLKGYGVSVVEPEGVLEMNPKEVIKTEEKERSTQ